MNRLPAEADRALAPVRSWLSGQAQERAAALLDEARAQAEAVLAEARSRAAAQLGRARDEGRRQAAADLARQASATRRQARAVVLGARQQARQELLVAVREAVAGLRSDAALYPQLLHRLGALARETLGEQAEVVESGEGGVLARHGSRQVDLSLPALAERTLADLERTTPAGLP